MRQRLAGEALVVVTVACVLGGCAPRGRSAAGTMAPQREPVYGVVDVVGGERASVSFGDGHQITFFREASPVTVDLRGVGFDESRAFAVGDGGTLLERGPRGSWHVDESGTRESLRAIDRVFASERVLVVGDHGTILVRKRADDRWQREPSPTNRDLFAVRDGFIVGARGTMLVNVDGRWRNVPTDAEEDLRTLWECSFNEHRGGATIFHKAICAAGKKGRIVRCTIEKLAVDCAIQPSPTTKDLFASSDWPLLFGGAASCSRR